MDLRRPTFAGESPVTLPVCSFSCRLTAKGMENSKHFTAHLQHSKIIFCQHFANKLLKIID